MFGFKAKKKSKKKRKHAAAGLIRVASRLLLPGIAFAAVLGSLTFGLRSLEAYVLVADPKFDKPPEILLTDVPEGLREQIENVIAPYLREKWIADDLCRRIGRSLEDSAWVREVRSVHRYADGLITVSCTYRQPVALVQAEEGFYALSAADGTRLPGRYGYDPAYVILQGVGALPPEPGGRWPGDDVVAGLKLIDLLHDEPFFDQLTGVLLDNFRGRIDKRQPHIQLAAAPSGGRIVWGSAPGEEVEENTIDEKIRLLWENYRLWGRIDAGRDSIDISVYPEHFAIRRGGSAAN